MQKRKIHIFHQKMEICALIKKSFLPDKYLIGCSYCSNDDLNFDYINNLDADIECIIMDKALNEDIKEVIMEKFQNIPIICLPALENDNRLKGIKYISEPLKISELSLVLEEIFSRKEEYEK